MKIISMTTHSPVLIDGNLSNFLHSKDLDFTFQESWVLVTSKKSGSTYAIPAANIPYMNIELSDKKSRGKAE